MKKIQLTKGHKSRRVLIDKFLLLDDEDYEYLKHWNWGITGNGRDYARTTFYHKSIIQISMLIHHFLIKVPKGFVVDHIDGNGLNNQKSNLRIATQQQNTYNQKIRTDIKTSKYKGVSYSKPHRQWVAYINFKKKRLHIGLFRKEFHAAMAYDIAAKDLHGEFARLNFKSI